MKKRYAVLGSVALLAIGAGVWWNGLDKETQGVLKTMPTNRDVLEWTIEQRDASFRAFDRLTLIAKNRAITKSPTPLPLTVGAPLNLPKIDEYMKSQRSSGIVIIQDGKLRFEKYGLGFDENGRWTSFSVAKSFTSTLVGAAIQDGYIKSLEDDITLYMPDLKGSAYDGVTVRQLLTMTSGADWNEDYEDPAADVAQFIKAEPEPGMDATISYMKKLKRAHKPGMKWHYNTGETNLIGVLVSSATKKPLAKYLEEKIWHPFGMEGDATWLLGSTGHEVAGCCLQMKIRDYARFGMFVLANGAIGDKQIVPKDWFAQATTKQQDIGAPGFGYGFQWWTYDDGSVAAQGIFGQGIFIDSKRKLVIASNANWPRANIGPEGDARDAFYREVQAAVDAEAKK